jgi:hypothetical protein
MNSNPVGKNYAQVGLEAHEKLRDYFESPASDFSRHQDIFSEEASRARRILHEEGCRGGSSFHTGDILIGPIEDQALTRMMEKKLEK